MSWRNFFSLALLFSCVDGFISNYWYTSIWPLLYRDILILITYLLFIFQEPVGSLLDHFRGRLAPFCWVFALLFAFVGFLQIFNSKLPSLSVGLLGFKSYFFYWPLAVLAYAYASNVTVTKQLLRRIALFSIAINLFGIYQFFAGPYFLVDHFGPGFERATIMASFEGSIDWEDSFVRVIGTFASAGQYAYFLVACSSICLSLFLLARVMRQRILYGGCFLLSLMALLATGSRGPLLLLGGVALLASRLCGGVRRGFWIVFIAALSLYFSFHWLGNAVVKRFETLRDLDMISERSIDTTPLQFQETLSSSPMGLGIGIATGASRHLLSEDSQELRMVENHPTKLLMEVGLVGVIFFYLFAIVMSLHWLLRWIPKVPEIQTLAGPLSAFCIIMFVGSFIIGGFDSPPQALFFWTFVGLAARLTEISENSPSRAS